MRIVFAALLGAFLTSQTVLAADAIPSDPSFECAHAATPIEHLICNDPVLAGLDKSMANAYRASRESKDDAGRADALQAQRQWIQSRFVSCGVALQGAVDPEKVSAQTTCLVKMYTARIAALKTATPAPTASSLASGMLDNSILPATGQQQAILTAPAFGRYAIAVKSDQGTALQLVDRMAGPQDQNGSAGHADGRIDVFLDKGQYKLKLASDPHGTGDAEISVIPSVELETTPKQLVELKPLDTNLDDHQQRSYWLNVTTRRAIVLEASGRYLDDLRIWRDGKWLIDATPNSSVAGGASGQPLAVRQLAVTLEPGLYMVTAYGGQGQKWANGSDAKPLHIRYGLPLLAEAGRTRRETPATGMDRLLVPASATYFRLDIDQPEHAAISIQPYDPSTPFQVGGNRATIDKTSRDPFATVSGGQSAKGSYTLVTVEYRPGTPYRLTWFDDRQERIALDVHAGQSGWLAMYNSGNDMDQLDQTVVVADPKGQAVASTALKVGKAIAWKRRFNLLSDSSLYLQVTEPVDLDVDGEGANAEYRIEPLIAGDNHRAPPDEPSGYIWKLDPGFYRLNIRPRPDGKGVLTMSLHAQGTPVPAEESPHQASAMLLMNFPVAGRYWIYGSTQADVQSGLHLYSSPIDLANGVAFEMAGGQSLVLPVLAPGAGRITATTEDGTVLPLTIDKAAASPSPALDKGAHSLALTLPLGDPRYVSVVFTPADLLAETPLPPMPQSLLDGLPVFPMLADGKPDYLDLAAAQHATFAVPVTKPALYRLESTGIIETTGVLRTRVLPNLDTETANGIGRNFLIQRYLDQGDYQLTVSPAGASHGNIGVVLSESPLLNLGTLTPGLTARTTLPPSQGGLYTFHIGEAGTYSLQTLGLGHQFAMRLEDADGWPLLPPGGPADVSYDFQPGDYRMVLLPGAVENRAVTLLSREEKPVERSGHGPFAVTFDSPLTNRWMEPAPGESRTPDSWTFRLPAAAETTVSIDSGMQATLTGKDGTAIGTASPGKDLTGKLPAGDYRIDAVSLQPNSRVDYMLNVNTKELVAGERRTIQAPADIPVSIGTGAPVEINSYGGQDVRARLTDATGVLVAANDDRDNDWNFSLATPLAPGAYTLHVDPVGSDSATTEVAIEQPAETTDAAATPGKAATIADALVHVVPIDPATLKANSLVVIAADAATPVGLSLERLVDGAWQAVGSDAGMNPFLGLPLGDKPDPLRLRIWSHDHTASPITYTVVDASPPTINENAIAKGSNLKPVAALGGKLGVLHIELDNPGVLFVDATATDLQASDASDVGTTVPSRGQLNAIGKDIWVAGRITAGQTLLQIRRADPDTGKPLQLTIPAGQNGLVLPVRPCASGIDTLWKLSVRGMGQAAVAPGDLIGIGASAYGGPEAAHVSVTVPFPDSDSIRLSQPDAAVQTPDLPVTLERFEYKVPEPHLLESGVVDGTFGGLDMVRFTLPEGPKTLWLDLPEGTATLLTNGESHNKLLWSWRARLIEVQADSENGISLFYTRKSTAAYSLRVLQGSPPTLQRNDKAGTLIVLNNPDMAGIFTALGDIESMMAIPASGDVIRGTSVPVGKGNYIQATIDFGPGLMGYATLSKDLPDGAATVDLDSKLAQKMPLAPVRIAAGPARLVRIQADVPAILYQAAADGVSIAPRLLDAGTDYFLLMPDGQSRDLMAVPGSTAAPGSMTLSVLTTTPITEGLGPKRRIAPGEARAFSFSLPEPRTIGAGVRASVDTANCMLVAPDGKQYGGGKLVMQALPAGTSLLVVSVPADSPPVEVEPALVGSVAPYNGPPDDVKAKYLAMVNRKSSQ